MVGKIQRSERSGTVTALSAPTAATAAALTDNSGGTASQTLADVTEANNAGSADRVPTENAIASLADDLNKAITDLETLRTEVAAIITQLNDQ